MRTSLLFLLLSSAAVPAFAADESDDRAARREAARAQSDEARGIQRPQRAFRGERAAAVSALESRGEIRPAEQEQQQQHQQRQEVVRQRLVVSGPAGNDGPPRATLEQRREAVDTVRERRGSVRFREVTPAVVEQPQETADSVREWRGPGRFRQVTPVVVEQPRESADSVRDWRRPGRFRQVSPTVIEPSSATAGGALREQRPQRAEPLETLGSRRAPIVSRIPREGTQPPLRASSKTSRHIDHHWRGDWRSDHRYNWREHRRRHRSLFRFGFYVDPFGWRYRPYSIGWRMWPSYYRSSYWLNDPWRYRLPYAPPGYRWIRYYDDLVLVDTWDGRVADVIYDFFW
jgi:Ni/Co efflux regulator RcnB